jgi:aminoglycoside phosphotransferase (APT) family kinase protein
MYGQRSATDLSNIVYYYVYGLFKIAVVVQQIYFRYHHGHTKDERFATLGKAAEGLCFKALRALQKNRVDNLF